MPVVGQLLLFLFFFFSRLIRWKMQIDNFGSQQSCTNSKESRIKISYNCWPFAGLAYMLRVKFSLFNVQPHPRVNAHRIMYAAVAGATVDGHSRHCCSFAILNLSRTIFAVDVFAIVDHFTVFHPLAMSYLI